MIFANFIPVRLHLKFFSFSSSLNRRSEAVFRPAHAPKYQHQAPLKLQLLQNPELIANSPCRRHRQHLLRPTLRQRKTSDFTKLVRHVNGQSLIILGDFIQFILVMFSTVTTKLYESLATAHSGLSGLLSIRRKSRRHCSLHFQLPIEFHSAHVSLEISVTLL